MLFFLFFYELTSTSFYSLHNDVIVLQCKCIIWNILHHHWEAMTYRSIHTKSFSSLLRFYSFGLPVSKRLTGHSSSSPSWLSPLRDLFLCWSSVSRRGITTDRNVLVPSWGQSTDASPVFTGFCGLILLDFRKSTVVLLLIVPAGSVRVEVATMRLFSEGCRSEESPFTSEVESISPSSVIFLWHFSGLRSTGFSAGGSETISEFVISGAEADGSSLGGNVLSTVK